MSIDAIRLLEKIEAQPHYLWSAAHDSEGRALLEEYAKNRALHEWAEVQREDLEKLPPEALYGKLLKQAYGPIENFRDPALGALYWAVADAVHETMLLYKQGSHEPFLNGALLANIRRSVSRARARLDGQGDGLRDLISLAFSDQAAQGNEAYSGADFGLIIEVLREEGAQIYAVLIQAKRAERRKVNVRRKAGASTQWERLSEGGAGAYLFYNEFGPRGPLPITIKSAELVRQIDQEHAVDPLRHASEFASWLAFGVSCGAVVGPRKADSRIEALRTIFDPDRGKPRVNDLLVTVLDEERISPRKLRTISAEWEELVTTAREDIEEGRRPFDPRPPVPLDRTD